MGGYAKRFVESTGIPCRTGAGKTVYALLSPTQKVVRDIILANPFYEGMVSIKLHGGDEIIVEGFPFLVVVSQKVVHEETYSVVCARTNVSLTLSREVKGTDGKNIVSNFEPLKTDFNAFGRVIGDGMKDTPAGLWDGTTYEFLVPESTGAQMNDRITMDGRNFRVHAADKTSVPGIRRLECVVDTRR